MRIFAHSNDTRWDAHQGRGYLVDCALWIASSYRKPQSFGEFSMPTKFFWGLPDVLKANQLWSSISSEMGLRSNLGLTARTFPLLLSSRAIPSIWFSQSFRETYNSLFILLLLSLDQVFQLMDVGREFPGCVLHKSMARQSFNAPLILFYEVIAWA